MQTGKKIHYLKKNKKKVNIGSLVLLSIIWGFYYVSTQRATKVLDSYNVGIGIRLITLILLTVLMKINKQFKEIFRVKGVVLKLILIGVLGYLLDFTAFMGLKLSSVGSGTALLKLDIFFVVIISSLIYKEKIRKKEMFFMVVMLIGVLILLELDLNNILKSGIGSIFFILSALFVAINAFIIQKVQKESISNNVIAFYNNFVTLILFTITSLITGRFNLLSNILINKKLFLTILISGVGQTLVYIFYYRNLKVSPVWVVKTFLLLIPIVSTLLSALLFGELIDIKQILGIIIILLGAFGILRVSS